MEESKATSAQLSYENYQGKTYATAVIARYIIFPQMKGKLKVIGNTYTVSVDHSANTIMILRGNIRRYRLRSSST